MRSALILASAATLAAICTALPASGVAPAAASAPQAFQICAACHTVSADRANGMGPNLRGIVGRKSGTARGFAYSPAMKRAGIIWTEANLDAYLTSPKTKVPGTSMPYLGMKNAAQRAEVVAYLKTLR